MVQDIASYEATQETLALLRLMAVGREDVGAGRARPLGDVIAGLRQRRYEEADTGE